ncbi:YhjD/YihY/BrkB family envelope integrity protein [Actinomycetospora callitridis]|uniref:YhjD/YihY/BrkB family envelope integrity protein n=1 Tax=Actinomycetospora callitridis TaxID=913944 RepID=UPI002365A6BB|nr:YhjD/YihY/BrkB family envelope integrity protein [Actinomycetospora callitridis]MDD7920125.1 YhjD/YihY/BrkB family envelope integrity protein [Actinomycetospora callitridis]
MPRRPAPIAACLALARDVGSTLRGRDLAAVAAGLTYFAALGVVPWLLLAVWGAALLTSPETVGAYLADLRLLVPPEMGARPVYDALVRAGLDLGAWGALVTVFPATFYGEGLRRACLRLAPRHDRFTGWRARLALLPLVLAVPVLALGVFAAAPLMADLARAGGFGGTLGQIVVAFHVSFVALGVVIAWGFRIVAPGGPGWRATLIGALGTAAVLAGFLQGFLLFLALPIDLGIPFGGLDVVGAAVAIALWMFVLHVLLLTGWATTDALDRRLRSVRVAEPPVREPVPVAVGAGR